MNVLSYHVLCPVRGWLAEDETSWTADYHESASFTSHQLAHDIAERETCDAFYVMACMGSL